MYTFKSLNLKIRDLPKSTAQRNGHINSNVVKLTREKKLTQRQQRKKIIEIGAPLHDQLLFVHGLVVWAL